jgi:hypothetical protein
MEAPQDFKLKGRATPEDLLRQNLREIQEAVSRQSSDYDTAEEEFRRFDSVAPPRSREYAEYGDEGSVRESESMECVIGANGPEMES